jgi:CHAD domain-containing protein
MSRKSKWLSGVGAEQPLSEVVRQAIQDRLELTLLRLPLAAKHADEDIEHVHQLRVATRRAQSALRLFSASLPEGRSARWARRLKKIRNAAGTARDLDVLIQRLEQKTCEGPQVGLQGIISDLRERRRRAQKPLRKVWKKCQRDHARGELRKLVRRIRWRGEGAEPEFRAAAPMALAPLVEDFFAAGAVDQSDPQSLHPMRLAGKKLRYAIELLSGAFDASLRDSVYPQFSQIQEDLGAINDHLVAKALFDQWLIQSDDCETDRELSRLITQEDQLLRQAIDHFRAVWTVETADRLRRQFRKLLYPPAPKARKKSSRRAPRALAPA